MITPFPDQDDPADDFPSLAHRLAIHRAFSNFQHAIIDRIAHDAGCSRDDVLAILAEPVEAAAGEAVH